MAIESAHPIPNEGDPEMAHQATAPNQVRPGITISGPFIPEAMEVLAVVRSGQPITRFGIHTLVERAAARAAKQVPALAAKRVSPHTIRHTTATHLLRFRKTCSLGSRLCTSAVSSRTVWCADLKSGAKVIAGAELASEGFNACYDFLRRVRESSRLGRFSYEPTKVVGTFQASRSDTVALAYQGFVLGELQGHQPSCGTLILLGDQSCKVKLVGKYKDVRRIIETLRSWTSQPTSEAPPVVLNKHCSSCPFQKACLHLEWTSTQSGHGLGTYR
jgi:predicted RecB family nuclease